MFQEDDLAFDGPLAPQYITEEKIVLFSYAPDANHSQPRFNKLYVGKAFEYR